MIPAYYSNQKAQACKSATIVFLHDVERTAEQTIKETIFSARDGWYNLGHTAGPFGTLTGWVLFPLH